MSEIKNVKHFILTAKEHEALQAIRNHMIANDDLECDIYELWDGHNNDDNAKRRTVMRLIAKGALKLTHAGYNNWVVPFNLQAADSMPDDAGEDMKKKVEWLERDYNNICDKLHNATEELEIETTPGGKIDDDIISALRKQQAEIERLRAEVEVTNKRLAFERDSAKENSADLLEIIGNLQASASEAQDARRAAEAEAAALRAALQPFAEFFLNNFAERMWGQYVIEELSMDDFRNADAATNTNAGADLLARVQQAESERETLKAALNDAKQILLPMQETYIRFGEQQKYLDFIRYIEANCDSDGMMHNFEDAAVWLDDHNK
jgi:DNA repair exonuclease SbcCD ATPase subunit